MLEIILIIIALFVIIDVVVIQMSIPDEKIKELLENTWSKDQE